MAKAETASKEEGAKKAAPKKTTAKKAPAKKKVVDAIQDTANLVENLTKAKAYAMVRDLSGDVDFTFFKLGGVLSAIQHNDWFVEEGYENFRDFVEEEFGIKYRKAMYMIEIYNNLVDAEIPWEKVKDIGWTKLKELAKILDAENVDDWVSIASENTVIQLQEEIKKALKGDTPTAPTGDDKEDEADKVSTKTFKMHADQKEIIDEAIEKGKNDAGTDVDTVALEAICMNYLNSSGKKTKAVKQKSLNAQMKEAGWEEVLTEFDALFPEIDISVEA